LLWIANNSLVNSQQFVNGDIDTSEPIFRTNNRPGRAMTRQATDPRSLIAQHARTDVRKYSLSVRATDTWNKLDSEMRYCISSEHFTAKQKTKHKRN
jgi:hypothetical protein